MTQQNTVHCGGGVAKMYERPSLKRVYFRFDLSHQKSKNIG